jgi:hypothetical protein
MSTATKVESKTGTTVVQSTTKPVHNDESYRSIVILKSTALGMKNAENFLTNRNWLVFSSHKIQEAVAQVMQKNPKYVLIAADHPNKKVQKLPIFLKQTLDVSIISFTESTKKDIIAAMQEISDHNIHPPVSGPSIERMLLKIKKDGDHKDDVAKESASKLRAQAFDEKNPVSLTDFLSDEPDDTHVAGADGSTKSDLHIQKGHLGEKINYNPQNKGAGTSEGAIQARTPESPELSGTSGVAKVRPNPASQIQKGQTGNFGNYVPKESEKKEDALQIQKGVAGEMHSTAPPEAQEDQNARRLVFKGDENSIFVQGVQSALDNTSRVLNTPGSIDMTRVKMIEHTSHISCITIKSQRFSGYLVTAMGKNRKMDDAFLEMIRERLFQFLKNRGEQVDDKDSFLMNLKIQPVDFDSWTMKQAEFLRKSIHNDEEVAMAFFPSAQARVELLDSEAENMCQINVDHIHENSKLDFDIYLYMPTNKKYVLYTQKDSVLGSAQKLRLKEKGMTHFHLKKEHSDEAKKYVAKAFLNKQIEDFIKG